MRGAHRTVAFHLRGEGASAPRCVYRSALILGSLPPPPGMGGGLGLKKGPSVEEGDCVGGGGGGRRADWWRMLMAHSTAVSRVMLAHGGPPPLVGEGR